MPPPTRYAQAAPAVSVNFSDRSSCSAGRFLSPAPASAANAEACLRRPGRRLGLPGGVCCGVTGADDDGRWPTRSSRAAKFAPDWVCAELALLPPRALMTPVVLAEEGLTAAEKRTNGAASILPTLRSLP